MARGELVTVQNELKSAAQEFNSWLTTANTQLTTAQGEITTLKKAARKADKEFNKLTAANQQLEKDLSTVRAESNKSGKNITKLERELKTVREQKALPHNVNVETHKTLSDLSISSRTKLRQPVIPGQS
jgi:septal ring factor EnvC (AmiA/AmiB activator)